MNRGDVVELDWPFSELTGTKRRPAVVVQADYLKSERNVLPSARCPVLAGGCRRELDARLNALLKRSSRAEQLTNPRAIGRTHADAARTPGSWNHTRSRSPGTPALTFVCQSWEQLQQTPKNVVIVVISLQQQHLRMTTFFGAKRDLK